MKWYQISRGNHRIRLRRVKTHNDSSPEEGRRSIRVIHDIRLKPMKAMKRLLRFWM